MTPEEAKEFIKGFLPLRAKFLESLTQLRGQLENAQNVEWLNSNSLGGLPIRTKKDLPTDCPNAEKAQQSVYKEYEDRIQTLESKVKEQTKTVNNLKKLLADANQRSQQQQKKEDKSSTSYREIASPKNRLNSNVKRSSSLKCFTTTQRGVQTDFTDTQANVIGGINCPVNIDLTSEGNRSSVAPEDSEEDLQIEPSKQQSLPRPTATPTPAWSSTTPVQISKPDNKVTIEMRRSDNKNENRLKKEDVLPLKIDDPAPKQIKALSATGPVTGVSIAHISTGSSSTSFKSQNSFPARRVSTRVIAAPPPAITTTDVSRRRSASSHPAPSTAGGKMSVLSRSRAVQKVNGKAKSTEGQVGGPLSSPCLSRGTSSRRLLSRGRQPSEKDIEPIVGRRPSATSTNAGARGRGNSANHTASARPTSSRRFKMTPVLSNMEKQKNSPIPGAKPSPSPENSTWSSKNPQVALGEGRTPTATHRATVSDQIAQLASPKDCSNIMKEPKRPDDPSGGPRGLTDLLRNNNKKMSTSDYSPVMRADAPKQLSHTFAPSSPLLSSRMEYSKNRTTQFDRSRPHDVQCVASYDGPTGNAASTIDAFHDDCRRTGVSRGLVPSEKTSQHGQYSGNNICNNQMLADVQSPSALQCKHVDSIRRVGSHYSQDNSSRSQNGENAEKDGGSYSSRSTSHPGGVEDFCGYAVRPEMACRINAHEDSQVQKDDGTQSVYHDDIPNVYQDCNGDTPNSTVRSNDGSSFYSHHHKAEVATIHLQPRMTNNPVMHQSVHARPHTNSSSNIQMPGRRSSNQRIATFAPSHGRSADAGKQSFQTPNLYSGMNQSCVDLTHQSPTSARMYNTPSNVDHFRQRESRSPVITGYVRMPQSGLSPCVIRGGAHSQWSPTASAPPLKVPSQRRMTSGPPSGFPHMSMLRPIQGGMPSGMETHGMTPKMVPQQQSRPPPPPLPQPSPVSRPVIMMQQQMFRQV
eukprot:GHVL01023788.1.p1 GENE.GHVL01023788.1~~GHVL01023788.1.p1  ORF type:complete len:972 (+),score=169.77 GHVL01023788.1:138-3053(+)